MRAQLQRLHQQRHGEDVVHDDEAVRILRVRVVRYGGDTVLYLNSFSKSLVPGLHLGYLLVPGRFEKRLILAKFNADIASPALLQEMLALYLQCGLYAVHLERLVT